jgi:hypothetical protein
MTKGDAYNLIFGVLFILLGKVGDDMETHPSNYSCPPYCDINHMHLPIKEKDERCFRFYNTGYDSLYIVPNCK